MTTKKKKKSEVEKGAKGDVFLFLVCVKVVMNIMSIPSYRVIKYISRYYY